MTLQEWLDSDLRRDASLLANAVEGVLAVALAEGDDLLAERLTGGDEEWGPALADLEVVANLGGERTDQEIAGYLHNRGVDAEAIYDVVEAIHEALAALGGF